MTVKSNPQHNGRFGPYLQQGKISVSIDGVDALNIPLGKALDIKQSSVRGSTILKDLGSNDKIIQVKKGRFGPYVTDGSRYVVQERRHSNIDP